MWGPNLGAGGLHTSIWEPLGQRTTVVLSNSTVLSLHAVYLRW